MFALYKLVCVTLKDAMRDAQELALEHAWTKDHQLQLAVGLRSTLQMLTKQASAVQQPMMMYKPNGHQQPAVPTLLKAAIGLAQKVRIGKGMPYQDAYYPSIWLTAHCWCAVVLMLA